MKVLSVQQPYADLILSGRKPVENRTWRTKHRGRLYIHASKWASKTAEWEWTSQSDYVGNGLTQAIIGHVELVDIVAFDLLLSYRRGCPKEICKIADRWTEDQIQHAIGPECWILTNPVWLNEAIAGIQGRLNVWTFEV